LAFLLFIIFIFLAAGILTLPRLLLSLARGIFNRTGYVDDTEQQDASPTVWYFRATSARENYLLLQGADNSDLVR
jgi:hypothetical protein